MQTTTSCSAATAKTSYRAAPATIRSMAAPTTISWPARKATTRSSAARAMTSCSASRTTTCSPAATARTISPAACGADKLTGGAGGDTFVFNVLEFGTKDTVTDFKFGEDKLQIVDLFDGSGSDLQDLLDVGFNASSSGNHPVDLPRRSARDHHQRLDRAADHVDAGLVSCAGIQPRGHTLLTTMKGDGAPPQSAIAPFSSHASEMSQRRGQLPRLQHSCDASDARLGSAAERAVVRVMCEMVLCACDTRQTTSPKLRCRVEPRMRYPLCITRSQAQ